MTSATALLIAQSLLSQWFLYYEVPGKRLDQFLPLLSSQVEISTGSIAAPITGLDSVLELAETQGPTRVAAANSHEIRGIEILEMSETSITARANVIYRRANNGTIAIQAALRYSLTLTFEGDRFRISRLVTSPTTAFEIPAISPTPAEVVMSNLVLAAQSAAALEEAAFSPSSLRNEVEAFVSRWYRFFDLRPEAEQLEPMLAADPIDIWMFQSFTTREAYLTWYRQMRLVPMLNAHRVIRVDLREAEENRVVADLYIIWESEREGVLQTLPMRNVITLVRGEDGQLRAQAYAPGRLPF